MRIRVLGREHRTEIIALRQAAMVNTEFGRRLQRLQNADSEHLHDHVEYVRKAGHSLPGEPALVVSAIQSLVSQFAYTWLVEAGPDQRFSDDNAIDMLTDFIYRALTGTVTG